jgi:hypothetical protein
MKRFFFLLIFLVCGIGLIYFYQTNSEFESSVANWLGITKYDSLEDVGIADTVARDQRTKKLRSRIPKKIKPNVFDNLDKYARNAPDKYSHSIKDLADYLVIPAKNDLEKTRLAFTWIATHVRYDAEAYNTGNYKAELSADSVLMRRAGVCEGYSTLFMELAKSMKLEAVKISGYAKGYGLGTNKKFADTNHAWNAVRISGKWQLIDVTWGSGYGDTNNNKLESIMEFDPYWFCVKPNEYIFSHLPENNEWQLTRNPINLIQFEELPYVDQSIFELGFDGDEVFNTAIVDGNEEFVKTYSVGFPIKKVELPLTRSIEKGATLSFILQSDYVEEMAIIDGEQWTYFKKENERFSASHIPRADELQIAVKINWFDVGYTTIVEYKVNGPKN